MSTKNFSATITSRYGEPDKAVFHKVMDLVKKNNIAKSRAQLLLVKRGLEHTNNPEPLIREKVVYRDRVVEKPVEKVVYKDRPDTHIRDSMSIEHLEGDPKSEQHPSGDKLMTRDKASPSQDALEVKKSPTHNNIAGWIGLGSLLALAFGPVVYHWLTKS